MFDFLSYINVDMPSNFQKFISKISNNIFSILPNFFEIDDGKYNCKLHPKLRDNGLSCLTLNNMGGNLLVLILIIGLMVASKLVDMILFLMKIDQLKILKNKNRKMFSFFLKTKNMIGSGLYWAVFNGM